MYMYTVYVRVHSETIGQTTSLAFMNITPDVTELGYIQIYAVAPNKATVNLQVKLYYYTKSFFH